LSLFFTPLLRAVLIGIREHNPQDGNRDAKDHVPNVFHLNASQCHDERSTVGNDRETLKINR
jgi:hypothetical protein